MKLSFQRHLFIAFYQSKNRRNASTRDVIANPLLSDLKNKEEIT